MDEEQFPAVSHRAVRLAEKLHDEKYRHGYVEAHSRRFLARQMRKFRGKQTQSEFGTLIDKRQTVVSRLEDANYRGWTLGTMFEIARCLGVAAFVRFVDFQTFLKYSGDMSEEAIHPRPYDKELVDIFAGGLDNPAGAFPSVPLPDYLSGYEFQSALGALNQVAVTGLTSSHIDSSSGSLLRSAFYGVGGFQQVVAVKNREMASMRAVITEKDQEITDLKQRLATLQDVHSYLISTAVPYAQGAPHSPWNQHANETPSPSDREIKPPSNGFGAIGA